MTQSIVQLLSDHSTLYAVILSAEQQGRVSLYRVTPHLEDLLPEEFSIGSHINEYGGRSVEIQKGRIFFIHAHDQGIYELKQNTCQCLYQSSAMRFADLHFDRDLNALFCICENTQTHTQALARLDLDKRTLHILIEGASFYSSIDIDYKQKAIAWVEWNHPHMPWDESKVVRASIDEKGSLTHIQTVHSAPHTSVTNPRFAPNGALYLISDQTNYWNLYRADQLKSPCFHAPIDFAEPIWQLSERSYLFLNQEEIVLLGVKEAENVCILYNRSKNTFEQLDIPFTSIKHLILHQNALIYVASSFEEDFNLYQYDFKSRQTTLLVRLNKSASVKSIPESITLCNRYHQTLYSYYYAPKNIFSPPLIVKCHSGPTSRVSSSFNPQVQFFTENGFAFLETNYGGSTGYGREYRERLNGKWGNLDATDCIDSVEYLITQGKVNPEAIFLMGSSSGAFTALRALILSHRFKGATLLYPVTDLIALVESTHPFEKHYFDSLIAPYSLRCEDYIKFSLKTHLKDIKAPLCIFHGKKDRVIPAKLTEDFVLALKALDLPVTLTLFEHEGHSFKTQFAKQTVLNSSLQFFNSLLSDYKD